jgi:uncharacterized protein involved in outer membrane biogenesis
MKRKVGVVVFLLLAALAGAPFFKADRFGPRIQAGLENALGRKVEIGAVRLHLLTGPGFSVRKVVIHERPEVSAEPFAYVDDLVVRIRLLGLISGKLEFSSLRLDKPHVNLMRQADGAWNVQALLAPKAPSPKDGGGIGSPMPELEVRRGRLNFKIEDRKSAYYFTDADIDFSSVGDGNFDIWFVGEMARTDRMARGLGRVTARGRLRDTGGEPKLNLDAQLERSALQELAQLVGPAGSGSARCGEKPRGNQRSCVGAGDQGALGSDGIASLDATTTGRGAECKLFRAAGTGYANAADRNGRKAPASSKSGAG